MKTKTTTFLWLCGILTALFVTQSAFAVDVRPGSEYITEKLIRDTKNQTSDPKPFSLNIETLDNGSVRFTLGSIDGTTITWRDQGIILDNLQLWTNGASQAAKNYFTKVNKPDKEASFDLVPTTTIPSDAVIVYNQSLMYWYGTESRATNIQGKQDYLIYTYGTNTSDPIVSPLCNMHLHQNGSNDAYLTATLSEGGVITFTISNEAGTAYFRADDGGGMDAGQMILRSYTNATWCGKNMGDYFDRTTITNNVDNIPQNQNIVFTPKSGVTVPEDLVISFYDTQIAWRIGTTSAWNKFPWRYHYGTGCAVGKTIKAAATNITKYTADITLDKSKFYDGAAYKIKIKEDGGTYSYVSGGPFSESDFPYTLKNLSQGTAYNVVIEGAYPDFDNPEDEQSSNTVKFTTIVSGSEVCDRQFVNGDNSVGVSLETLPDGSLAWTITSSIPEGATWKAETWAAEANSIYVNGTQGATYFNNPVITADGKSAVLTPKQAIPENAVITLQSKKIVWYNAKKETVWIDGGTQFDNFTYTYGKYCCALGALRLQITDINRSSANVYAANGCIADDGLDYVYCFKYKKRTDAEYTVIEGFNSVYPLSGLQSGTQYDIVLEAAYPSFDNPERYEVANASFSTLTNQSDVCDLEFTSGKSTAAFSFVTAENGNMELIIGGAETNYAFREKPSIDKFQVNGTAATAYFDATVWPDDKSKIILPLKTGSAIKADDVVKFNDGTLAWKSDAEGNAWVSNKSFTTRYNTTCCAEGKQLTAEVVDVQYNSASIKILDPCLNEKDYVYRLRYRIGGGSVYNTIEGRPTDGIYELTGLVNATDYEAIAEAAYPSFESPTLTVEQSVVEFTTLSKGSESCGVLFTYGGSTIGVSMESTLGGDLIISMSTDEENGCFRVEGLSSDINTYKVNGADASTYFDAPELNSDKTIITLRKKGDLPNDAVITFNGVVAWSTEVNPNAYVMGANLTHTYGTVCCKSGNMIKVNILNATKNSASIKLVDDCIIGENYEYKMSYRIRNSQDEYTTVAGRPESGVYELSGLFYDTEYEVKVEVGYPSLSTPDKYELQNISFSTLSASSQACQVQFIGFAHASECFVSMETSPTGDVVVSISGADDIHFRSEGLTADINCYKVNGTDASVYFDAPVLSADNMTATLKSKGNVPESALITFNGTVSWGFANPEDDDYLTAQSMSHTYGTWCCDVSGFKIIRCEGLSNATAITEIDNLCIEDKPYQYRYSLKEDGGEYGEPAAFTGFTINLDGLKSATSYEIKIEAALPDFESPIDVREQIGAFATSALSPAPVPAYSEDLVMSVYSSTYGEAANLDWNYYTFVKELSDEVISSESVLKKCVMYANPTPGKEPQNGVLVKYPSTWDVSSMLNIRFDLWISEDDAVKSPYVGLKLRNVDGANTSWYVFDNQLIGNTWNTFVMPLAWFVENEELDLSSVISMMIIPLANKTSVIDDAQFSSEEYTIYLDNIFYYVPGVAKIGTQYYETLAGALEAVQDGETIDLLASVKEDLVVDGKNFNINANGKSVNNITISETGSLTLESDINVKGDLILKSGVSESGNFNADGNSVTVVGNAYFDKQFTNGASSMVWYGLSLPFAVDVNEVYSAVEPYENLPYYEQWALQDYNGALRADGVTGWDWVEPSAGLKLQSGKLYSLVINQFAKYKALRFKAANKSELFASTTIPLTHYTGSGVTSDFGWNGVGNNQLFKANMETEAIYGQVIDVAKQDYTPVYFNSYTFNPGECVFVQSTADGQNIELSAGTTKSAEVSVDPFAVLISAKGSDVFDRSYVSASEDASEEYELGKDLAEIGNYNSGNFVSMWIEAYGKALACADLKMYGGVAETAIGLYAPKAGNYRMYLEQAAEGQELILTKNGAEIFNFANGEYEFALSKGINAGYGLKVVSTDIPTDATNGEAGDIKVYSKDGILYISGLTEGTPYLITNMFANVAEGISNGNVEQIALPTGIYGVLVNGKCIKIVEQ